MKSELKCLAAPCKYINGVQIWASAIDLEHISEEGINVAVEVNGLPTGLHRE